MSEPIPGLPEGLVLTLRQTLPDFTLIGALARDYHLHTVAGLPTGSATKDVDVSILVPSLDAYHHQLRPFFGPNATGIRFQVDGFEVDVIPYGPRVAPGGVVEPAEGLTLDITGMAEAAATAEAVTLGSTAVKVPTLSSMIGLKLVAWHYRHVGEPNKDARDLGPLLQATRYGPHGEALWDDGEALDRWEYQDHLVGPYRAGRQLCAKWEASSLERLADILDGDGLTSLASHISRASRETVTELAAQLAALRAGITGS